MMMRSLPLAVVLVVLLSCSSKGSAPARDIGANKDRATSTAASRGAKEHLAFGAISGGLRASVEIARWHPTPGAAVPVTVFLKNEGTKPVVILPYSQPQNGWSVKGPDGRECAPKNYELDGGNYDTTRRTRIGPGEVTKIIETDFARDYDLSKPGEYTARFRYVLTAHSFRENTEADRADLDAGWVQVQKDGIWRGEVSAPEVVFRIGNPPAEKERRGYSRTMDVVLSAYSSGGSDAVKTQNKAPIPDQLVFGRASGGLRAAVWVGGSRFAPGASVPVRVFLRNEGKKPAVILPYLEPQVGWSVRGPGGKNLYPKEFTIDAGLYKNTQRLTIPPGSTVTILDTDLASWFDLSIPGRYVARFVYVLSHESFQSNIEAADAKSLDEAWAKVLKDSPWLGEAAAPEIALTVIAKEE